MPQNNNYEPSIYDLFDYNIDPTPHYENQFYSPSFSPSHSITTAYSTFTPSQPKSVQYSIYDPNCYQLTFTASRQVKSQAEEEEFNAPEFEEYDSTPYGGGYDIVQTYGRPLPPSNQTCYRQDGRTPKKKKVTFADVDAEGEEKKKKKNDVVKPEKLKEEGKDEPKEEAPREGREIREAEWDNRTEIVSQIPSGYGLEAMDLCESLFGFWPCHSRYYAAARGSGSFACYHGYGCGCGGGRVIGCGGEQGKGAADYIFGSSDPYVERRDGGGSFGQPIHCYERRFQEQPLTVEVEFDQYEYEHQYRVLDQEDDSWSSQNFGIF